MPRWGSGVSGTGKSVLNNAAPSSVFARGWPVCAASSSRVNASWIASGEVSLSPIIRSASLTFARDKPSLAASSSNRVAAASLRVTPVSVK